MTPEDKQIIEAWGQSQTDDIQITLAAGKDDTSLVLSDFCDQLVQHAPPITVHRKRPEKDGDLPAIILSARVRYHAAPWGPELPHFLSFLAGKAASGGLSEDRRKTLSTADMPALFQVFIAPRCPFCPETVGRLLALADMAPGVRLSVIDAVLFQAVALRHEVKSVPSVILDGQFRWTGGVDLSELSDLMLNRDPAQLSAASLLGVIEDGKSTQVVDMMIGAGKLFPAVFELLTDEKWPVRLGAMVTLESIADRDAGLAAAAVGAMLDRLPGAPDAIQGDMLYLLGEMGGSAILSQLASYRAAGGSDAVKEAASDAMEAIREREKNRP